MLRPFLLIGVGGSGGKTLRAIRHNLELKLQAAGWAEGIPEAWQFLHYDTPVKQDGGEFGVPFLPPSSYHGLVAASTHYDNIVHSLMAKANKDTVKEIGRQLPDPAKVDVTIVNGAGQYRAVGRAIALSKLDAIATAAEGAINRMSGDKSKLGELSKKLGIDSSNALSDPIVLVISSVSGGSGAGQYIDVIEAIKSRYSTTSWARETYGILYAPDVFDGIPKSGGIPSNSLNSVTETVSGYWNNNPNNSTVSLFQSKGLTVLSGGANDRIGVRYPLIIGREGDKVAFKDQGDVYRAIATTISAWMTDDLFQARIGAYIEGNFVRGTDRDELPDASRLTLGDHKSPALSGFGFGRVTLAREKFIEYSSERLAKSVITRMLKAHAEADPMFELKDEEAWIRYNAEKNQVSFIRESGLNEETEDNDDVINELRDSAALNLIISQFKSQVKVTISDPNSLDPKTGGLPVDEWYNRLVLTRQQQVDIFLDIDQKNRQARMDDWVVSAPEKLAKVVTKFVAYQGMRVTEQLLEGLSKSLERASGHLSQEAATRQGWVEQINSYINDELSKAGSANSLTPDDDVIEMALSRVGQSLEWQSEANLRLSASALLSEMNDNFVIPMKRFLRSSHDALLANTLKPETNDGRRNDFTFWPDRTSDEVLRKYEPASNERMLLEIKEFSPEFKRLVSITTGVDKYDDAIIEAMANIMLDLNGEALLSIPRSWKPKASADPKMVSSSSQLPAFDWPNNPEDYLDRAKTWMKRMGTPFRSYINMNLKDYLDKNQLSPDEYNSRKIRFLSHIQEAFRASSPLVKLHPGLYSQVHSKVVGQNNSVIVSSIPFGKSEDMYEATAATLLSEIKNYPVEKGTSHEAVVDSWFRDQNASSVEFFTVLGYPVQPMVMASIMDPIASRWSSINGKPDQRNAFMRWTRGRLLNEALPIDRKALIALIKGWYVASVMKGTLESEENSELGKKWTISDPNGNKLSFPFPLYASKFSAIDTLPVILESIKIAIAQCTSFGSLDPLKPYWRLMDIAGEISGEGDVEGLSADLAHRIDTGTPLGTSGASHGTADEVNARKRAVMGALQANLDEVIKATTEVGPDQSVYSYPLIWELRDEVKNSIQELIDLVASYTPSAGSTLTEGVI